MKWLIIIIVIILGLAGIAWEVMMFMELLALAVTP